MTAIRLMPRAEWERRLRGAGCVPDPDEQLEIPGEWWKTEHGFVFPVYCDTDGNLRPEDWQQVLITLARAKPMDWDT